VARDEVLLSGPFGPPPGYTLRSSNDPRGRLRGGVACGLGSDVAADFGNACGAIGAARGGVVRTLAGWTVAGRPAAGGAWAGVRPGAAVGWPPAALAMPMKVAGDNMTTRLACNSKRTINRRARTTSRHQNLVHAP
jgi:hypothetical protein